MILGTWSALVPTKLTGRSGLLVETCDLEASRVGDGRRYDGP